MTASSATILIVDDEVRSLESLKRVLADEVEVLCARKAAEVASL